ncbi:cation:proton antiporter [Candidatus Kuenenia sp.]|uniref:cation:proton antiporter n=1 Tax=Candidatus Kuenenia sp. TaxID=2499824 RepID=UPI0032207759
MPVLEAKHLEPSNDSQPIHADTQKESDSLAAEENGTQTTIGDNKPIQTPVIEDPPPTTVDMGDISIQTPDSNTDVIITGKEVPYTSKQEENKHPQEIAHPDEDGPPIVPAEEALSGTTEQEHILATPTPILSVTPTGYGQSLIEEEKEIHTPSPDGELSQAIPIEIGTPHVTKEHTEDESSIEEIPPQHTITTESIRDADVPAEEATSVNTAQDNILATPTPILSVTPTGTGQSLIEEEMEIPHTPLPDGELSQVIPIEKETPHEGEDHPGDESPIEEVESQHAKITATPGDTEEKGVLSVMPVPTPEYAAASVDAEESLVPIEKDKPSHDGESGLPPTNSVELLPFAPIEGFSRKKEGIDTELPIKDAGDSTTGRASEEHRIDPVKEDGVSTPAWDILHKDPTHGVILAVAIILIAAKIGELLAKSVKLPSVVGNLLAGVVLGNIYIFTGGDFFDFLKTMPFLKMISYFGTLILLFTAGLHTDIRMLLRAGASSFLVSLGGIIAPAGLGLVVGHFFLPDASNGTKMLLAIIMCNTGMGLLTAVLGELKVINTLEGRILIGAAVITEIVVILSFGLVSGFVVREGHSLMHILVSVCIAISFLIIALIIILRYSEKFGSFLTKRAAAGLNIPIVVVLLLLLAFMTGTIGLHTVIGAFIAGLFLRNVKLRYSDDDEYRTVESFIKPFYKIIVPILFVKVGAQVDLMSFLHINTALLGLAITGAAIAGKMFCSVCPIERGVNRLTIGIGMAIKMEGTLILAGIGRDMGIFNSTVFSSAIMVIVFTSIICPYFLRAFLQKKGDAQDVIPVVKAEKELEGTVLN